MQKINNNELKEQIKKMKKKSFLNIDSSHFNKVMQNINVENVKSNKENNIFLQKIKITIPDFYDFSDNHFYNNRSTLNFNLYKRDFVQNQDDLNVLEDFLETNSNFDNFTKNFCRFILKVFRKLSVSTLGKIVNVILKDPTLFYKLYVSKMFQLYSQDCFSFVHEKHIKLIDFNQNLQRNPKNHVSILSEDCEYILNFILP